MTDILIPVQVVLKLFIMANELLNYWVVGNALTEPSGSRFVESIAVVLERMTYIHAWLWSII